MVRGHGYGSPRMKHGARATDEADMIGIFITDNAFEIFYKDDE